MLKFLAIKVHFSIDKYCLKIVSDIPSCTRISVSKRLYLNQKVGIVNGESWALETSTNRNTNVLYIIHNLTISKYEDMTDHRSYTHNL